ncbi:protein TIFY 10A-like isoform X2 [Apium graveolens]
MHNFNILSLFKPTFIPPVSQVLLSYLHFTCTDSRDFTNMPRISPEKSTFAQTCDLLSHYIKEKGTIRDLHLGINGEATDTSFSGEAGQASTQVQVQEMNLFPQHACMHDDAISFTTSSERAEYEPRNAQMTIFYAGQVLVFDDISAVKAQQVMQLANKSVTQVDTSTGFVIPSNNTTKFVENQRNSMSSGSVQSQNDIKQQWQPIVSEMPIARKASLHRFLSKRKDR